MKIKILFVITVGILLLTFITLFGIDQYRMKNNMPVLFSKWGAEYAPVETKSFELIVNKSDTEEEIKITTGELSEKYDYDIYYYGLESVKVKFKDKMMDLRDALLANEITMEEIIDEAEKLKVASSNNLDNFDYSIMANDGGSRLYRFESYTIIKKHTLEGNQDVYIGIPTMTL